MLDRRLQGIVTHLIFPTPSATSKGVLIIPTVDGPIMVGPTAEDVNDRKISQPALPGRLKSLHRCVNIVRRFLNVTPLLSLQG